uniref:Uncharacterized protein n=1 Tax=Timema cristinae TaxID=61476 RepID=A0A7R9H480_TIMCR|nr:unnamed protein product [Timema cristinae]
MSSQTPGIRLNLARDLNADDVGDRDAMKETVGVCDDDCTFCAQVVAEDDNTSFPLPPSTHAQSPPVNGSAMKPVPPPRDHLRIEKDGRLVNRAPGPQVPARYANITALNNNNTATDQSREPTKEQLDSIRKFQVRLLLLKVSGVYCNVGALPTWGSRAFHTSPCEPRVPY